MKISEELQNIYDVKYNATFEFTFPFKDGDGNEFSAICTKKAKVLSYLFVLKGGISVIKIYPTLTSTNSMMLIIHFFNEKAGLGNSN